MPKAKINYRSASIRNFYAPYISFDVKTREFLNTYFIGPKINNFLEIRGITKQLNDDFLLTDIMFNDIAVGQNSRWDIPSYFYDEILASVHRDPVSRKLIHEPMYSITFSKDNVSKLCEETQVMYSAINLYDRPVFYYIYIDLQELISFLQTSAKA